jgi:hypothetical protein
VFDHIIRARLATAFGVLAVAALASLTGVARADSSAACNVSAQDADGLPFALAGRALTDPTGADLTVRLTTATDGCVVPDTIDHLQVKTFADDGSVLRVQHFTAVAAPGGVATVDIGKVARGQRVSAQASFRSGTDPQELVTRVTTSALLRPDLAVTVSAQRQVLAGRPFTAEVQVVERNGDTGAKATLTLNAGATQVGTTELDVAAGETVTRSFTATATEPGALQLAAAITGASPREANLANNEGRVTVEVTEFELNQSQVLVPALAGYGSHFNHRVYAKISRDVGVTPENVGDMESKMVALQPQFSRIFVNNADLIDADRKASFVKTVLLAQRAGTTINITWQGGTLDLKTGTIQRLAAILNDLVQNQGVTNLRWLTLQNEPNGTRVTPQEIEARYRTLDPFIFPIRGQVRYMGGDLVRNGGLPNADQQDQQVWFDYMATHMADILDAWSIHVFWDFWDTQKLQDRLTEVRAIWDAEPEAGRKPLYVTEYGVRGIRTFNGVAQIDPGVWTDGTPITQTNINAFQHAWFDILSAREGYLGTTKWDSYFGKYDNGTQAYFMLGAPQNNLWPVYPVYNDVRLWTMSVKPGWKVVGLDGTSGSKLLASYAGPAGELTVLGLDTSGAQLNTLSSETRTYSIGGLPAFAVLHLAVWNEHGDGQNAVDGDVVVDPAGVATISVPLNAVFSLTTMPVAAG